MAARLGRLQRGGAGDPRDDHPHAGGDGGGDRGDPPSDEIYDIAFDLRWPNHVTCRALANRLTHEWAGRADELRAKVAGYPPLGFVSELAEQGTTINLAGEATGLVDEILPAAEVVDRTVAEAERRLRQTTDVLTSG